MPLVERISVISAGPDSERPAGLDRQHRCLPVQLQLFQMHRNAHARPQLITFDPPVGPQKLHCDPGTVFPLDSQFNLS